MGKFRTELNIANDKINESLNNKRGYSNLQKQDISSPGDMKTTQISPFRLEDGINGGGTTNYRQLD